LTELDDIDVIEATADQSYEVLLPYADAGRVNESE
jgi:hypothetical protein